MVMPLIVYPCNEKQKLVKTHSILQKDHHPQDGQVVRDAGDVRSQAWLNSAIMTKWLAEVYHPHLLSTGQRLTQSILFMDNCSVQRTEECLAFSPHRGEVRVLPSSLHPTAAAA